jgi:hypothetical protein
MDKTVSDLTENTNRIFLVCKYHPVESQSICIGRRRGSGYYGAPTPKVLDRWYSEHATCGSNMDHIALSYQKTQDWKLANVDALNTAIHEVTSRAVNAQLRVVDAPSTESVPASAAADQGT